MPETPAETIRRAARLMRERAEAATCLGMSVSPWRTGEPYDCGCCEEVTDATGSLIAKVDDRQSGHVASWHPLAALAVAGWLESFNGTVWGPSVRHSPEYEYALKVARAYLGEAAG